MYWRSLLGSLLGVVAAAPLAAQIEERVREGDRVRLRVATEVTRTPRILPTRLVVGVIRTIAADTLYLGLATERATAVPRMFIQRVDRSLGPPSRRESAGEVALAGALMGVLIPPVLPKRTAAFLRGPDEGMLVGIPIGFLTGALVGFLFPYERWRPGWVPER